MGYEDQYKQAILNMTHNQGWEYYVINIHHFKRTRWVFKLCEGEKKKSTYCMLRFICELRAVLKPIIARRAFKS